MQSGVWARLHAFLCDLHTDRSWSRHGIICTIAAAHCRHPEKRQAFMKEPQKIACESSQVRHNGLSRHIRVSPPAQILCDKSLASNSRLSWCILHLQDHSISQVKLLFASFHLHARVGRAELDNLTSHCTDSLNAIVWVMQVKNKWESPKSAKDYQLEHCCCSCLLMLDRYLKCYYWYQKSHSIATLCLECIPNLNAAAKFATWWS